MTARKREVKPAAPMGDEATAGDTVARDYAALLAGTGLTSEVAQPAKKRGRPKKPRAALDGGEEVLKSGAELIRALIVMALHDQARKQKPTVDDARHWVVSEFKKLHPGMRISETEVARIVAELQPKSGRNRFVDEETGKPLAIIATAFDGNSGTVRIGERPVYSDSRKSPPGGKSRRAR